MSGAYDFSEYIFKCLKITDISQFTFRRSFQEVVYFGEVLT